MISKIDRYEHSCNDFLQPTRHHHAHVRRHKFLVEDWCKKAAFAWKMASFSGLRRSHAYRTEEVTAGAVPPLICVLPEFCGVMVPTR